MSSDFEKDYIWANHEAITVSNTAVGFTSSARKPASGNYSGVTAKIAKVSVETDSIRWSQDSTSPTSSVGTLQYATDVFYVYGAQNIANFKAIRVTTDATIQVQYGWPK